MELIEELRSTHALEETEVKIKLEEHLSTKALQRQRHLHERKEDVVASVLIELEGRNMGEMLQFLNKELIRLQVGREERGGEGRGGEERRGEERRGEERRGEERRGEEN